MLANSKINMVQELVSDLTKEEIIWLNGYLTALISVESKTVKSTAAHG